MMIPMFCVVVGVTEGGDDDTHVLCCSWCYGGCG